MKRDLIIQMRNEWRDNLWLVIGLIIVSLATWFLLMKLYMNMSGLFYEKGFDVTDVYSVNIEEIRGSKDYVERDSQEKGFLDSQDMRMLIANIRKSPYVEAAAFSTNGLPYDMSYYGNSIWLDMEPEDTLGYSGNVRQMSPDMARVLRLRSRTGKSEQELEDMLRNDEILVTNIFKYWDPEQWKPEDLLNNKIHFSGQERHYKVGDIIDQVRRSDYDIESGGMMIVPINENENFTARQIGIKIKHGSDNEFREIFENDASMREFGNHILWKLSKLTDVASSLQKSKNAEVRMNFALIMSLLIIIGLGILGVYWYRTQQRIQEIAIRKVCGANSGDIFKRIISEGLLLLVIASIFAAIIGWLVSKTIIFKESDSFSTNYNVVAAMFYSELMTFAIVAVGIILSLWWPAKRAMSIEPAIAIKYE